MRNEVVSKKQLQASSAETDAQELALRVYLASDIQSLLRLGKSKTYEFLNEVYKEQSPFRVLKVGKLYRVPKTEFDSWMNSVN